MCAIAGIYSLKGRPLKAQVLSRMNGLMKHRGPDGQGYLLVDTQLNKFKYYAQPEEMNCASGNGLNTDLALAHRRLSIIDLSEAGRQPMCSEDGQIWVVCNGEIFNYVELREDLVALGHRFKSRCDTEVIVHAYEAFGVDCVKYFNGMWAFTLWDARKKMLFCSRDRFGIKPYYYYFNGKIFSFASEIKALLLVNRAQPNERAVFNYLVKSFGFIDVTEETLFQHIYQLLPAHNLIVSAGGIRCKRYWEAGERRLAYSEQEAVEQFRALFVDAVRIRMRSDVQVAGALSGGLDSSAITCVIKKTLNINNYETYSACFDSAEYDERPYIRAVVEDTQFKDNYVFPDSTSLFDVIQKQLWFQDEPFNAMWVHSQWFIYQRAAENGVKVFLNGHGSDESLGGYYPHFPALWAELLRRFHWKKLFQEISSFRARQNGRALPVSAIARHLFSYYAPARLKELLSKEADFLRAAFLAEQRGNVYRYENPQKDLLNRYLYESLFIAPIRGMLHFDDRNSMAHSIEARVPFLDYRLIELVFGLPGAYKLKNGTNKFILREAMRDVLPPAILQRYAKKGFSSAAPQWFRQEKGYLRNLFNSPEFKSRQYLDHQEVLKRLDMHIEGKIDGHEQLCSWITLELWCRRFIDQNAGLKVEDVFK